MKTIYKKLFIILLAIIFSGNINATPVCWDYSYKFLKMEYELEDNFDHWYELNMPLSTDEQTVHIAITDYGIDNVCGSLIDFMSSAVIMHRETGEELEYNVVFMDVENSTIIIELTIPVSSNQEYSGEALFVVNFELDAILFIEYDRVLPLKPTVSLSNDKNYIVTATPFNENSDISITDVEQSVVDVAYYDGLGRRLQMIAAGQSGDGKDIVTPIDYDQYGRVSKSYLPFERASATLGVYSPTALSEQLTFYDNDYQAEGGYAFSKNNYENSPLNRLKSQTAPGYKWRNSSVKNNYTTNSANVKLWKVDASGNPYHNNISYSSAQLYVTEIEDENGVKTYEYKNKQGHTVETRQNNLTTSYIYDNLGLLRAVVPPKAQSLTVTGTEFKNLIFSYKYDRLDRLVEKKIPSAGIQYLVYDKRDRLVMSQDGNQRSRNQWKVYLYNNKNRSVAEGLITSSLSRTQCETYWANAAIHQTRSGSTYTMYTTNGIPALDANTVLSYTFYDDYSGWGAGTYNAGYFASLSPAYISAKSLVSGTKVKVLDGKELTAQASWLTSTIYYDFRGRVIQTHTGLYTSAANGVSILSTNYSFDGLPERIREIQTFNGVSTEINQRFVYDNARRNTHVYHKINTATEILVCQNTFDKLGRLKTVKQGNGEIRTNSYNIRGWIDKSVAGKFAYMLDYNLNGNINIQKWNRTGSSTVFTNTYSYTYDINNRLMSGNTAGFSESGITYDENGNITKLVRSGANGAGTYNYTYNGNTLTGISLNGGVNNAYTSDGNGNTIRDGLRGMNIEYNIADMPKKVSKGSDNIEYIYDAAGNKLAKKRNGAFINFYCGSVVYDAGKNVEYIMHSEGMARKNGNTWDYQYNLTDHLGNIRSVAASNNTVLQTSDYFPFGLTHNPVNSIANINKNKYLYNGKEIQNDVLSGTEIGILDYSARSYDPLIGRMKEIDPLTEKFLSFSPFVYTLNNPVRYNDPSGMSPDDPNEGDYDEEKNLWYSERFGWVTEEFYSYLKINGRQSKPNDQLIYEYLDGKGLIEEPNNETWGQGFGTPEDLLTERATDLAYAVGDILPYVPFVGSAYSYAQGSSYGDASTALALLGIVLDAIPGGGASKRFTITSKAVRTALVTRIGKRGYTEVGFQFQKHFGRVGGGFWKALVPKGATLNPSTYNKVGWSIFKEIWRAPGSFRHVNGFIEKRLPNGKGIRFQENWKFKGFLD